MFAFPLVNCYGCQYFELLSFIAIYLKLIVDIFLFKERKIEVRA